MIVDPYEILGVRRDDSLHRIKKRFKKLARLVHPDKHPHATDIERDTFAKQFKLVVDSFLYINDEFKRRDSGCLSTSLKTKFTEWKEAHNQNDHVEQELPVYDPKTFNASFDKRRAAQPGDEGYGGERGARRMQRVDDYEAFAYKPERVFDKHFDQTLFNHVYEQNQKNAPSSEESNSKQLATRTSDGFFGYNCGFETHAQVSCYKGMMIVGNDAGNGGYQGLNYSDFKRSFQTASNPTRQQSQTFVESSCAGVANEQQVLSKKEMKKRLKSLQQQRDTDGKASTASYTEEEQKLLAKQMEALKLKQDMDRRFVKKYQGMFADRLLKNN